MWAGILQRPDAFARLQMVRYFQKKCYIYCQHYLTNNEKLKSFVETFIPYNQILVFEEHWYMSNIDFMFDSD